MQKVIAIAMVCVTLTGCAAMRASSARTRHIHDATARHVYGVECARVLQGSRDLLFERGYSVKTVDTNTMTVETEWLYDADDVGKRFLVQAREPEPQTCRITMTSSIDSGGSLSTARDFATEWLLLQRLDPVEARAIEAEADLVYDQARGS